jgi:hypothetical protein
MLRLSWLAERARPALDYLRRLTGPQLGVIVFFVQIGAFSSWLHWENVPTVKWIYGSNATG